MAISEKDIKRLWGLAAGKCSEPSCTTDCIQFVETDDPLLIGEMAHVIAKEAKGPRGRKGGGEDTYENLVLLCPTHHRVVDKAPTRFPEELLHRWKSEHETRVRRALEAPHYESKPDLCAAILKLLIENRATWQAYGPDSSEAQRNPLSNTARLWVLRKLGDMLPKNRRIIHLVRAHAGMFDAGEYATCCTFIEHAEGFEASTYDRMEGVPRFPVAFEEVMRNAAAQ
ncbi:MAG TPA: hypothetical protein VHC69_02170 [Polyangiaceae bacterium]|nr:hypothetical protein [Polyangiaceae bacterium]